MVVLGAICLVFGLIGAIVGFTLAWALREDAKWVKRGVIIGIVCIVLFIVGIALLSSGSPSGSSSSYSSSSGKHRCAICGKSYSSGGTSNMCSQCYKNYKYAADAAGY